MIVALCLPVFVIFITLVVDVGNWFVHKRHLQMQADAGALAGGGLFTFPCSDDPILAETRKYAGDPANGAPYNLQVAPTDQANVHVLVNSDRYWNEGGTDFSDGGLLRRPHGRREDHRGQPAVVLRAQRRAGDQRPPG